MITLTMKPCKYFLPILVVLLAAYIAPAQTVKQQAEEDFIKISSAYRKHDKYKMNLFYTLYADSTPDLPVMTIKGESIINGTKKYEKVGEMESYHTEQYSLIFNHQLKTLSFLPTRSKEAAANGDPAQSLVSFLKECDSISYSDERDQRVYRFSGLPGNYDRVEVSFSRKTHMVNSLRLVSAYQESALLITYSDFTTKGIPGNDWFAYTNFLSYENQKLSCKTPFESYELFNKITNPEIIK